MADLVELVTTLAADPKAIQEAIGAVAPALQGDHPTSDARDAARLLFETVATRLLDWMATGDLERVRSLLAAIRAAQPEDPLASLSPLIRFQARLGVVEALGEIYLRSNNLARHMIVLAGARRAAWGEALGRACASERPLSARDLVAESIPRSTAYNILAQLAQHGLLERVEGDGPKALYAPTWAGRDAWKAWKRLGQGAAPATDVTAPAAPAASMQATSLPPAVRAELSARIEEAVALVIERAYGGKVIEAENQAELADLELELRAAEKETAPAPAVPSFSAVSRTSHGSGSRSLQPRAVGVERPADAVRAERDDDAALGEEQVPPDEIGEEATGAG